MADCNSNVRISTVCSSLDLRTAQCKLSGGACPFAQEKRFGQCQQCSFVANVTIHRSEFHVLLDGSRRPTSGLVPVRTCRATTWHPGAGAYVNAVMTEGPDRGLLQIAR